MAYGIGHENAAVLKYQEAATSPIHVRECGLFVDTENGQRAARPDRIVYIHGQGVVIEVKCLSASRTLSPLEAIKLKQCESGFAYKIMNGGVSLKENHPHYYQV